MSNEANFALERYAKAAEILKDVESTSRSMNEDIASASELVAARVGELLGERRAAPALSASRHRVALALIVGLPWLVMSVVGVVEAVHREPDWQYGLFGCLALAILLGGVGYAVPTEVHWFYRYLVFPLVRYSALLVLFFVAGDADGATEG